MSSSRWSAAWETVALHHKARCCHPGLRLIVEGKTAVVEKNADPRTDLQTCALSKLIKNIQKQNDSKRIRPVFICDFVFVAATLRSHVDPALSPAHRIRQASKQA
ncbi:MAG: hypothetical protein ACSLEZ_08515 [Thiobacillus sp.]